MTTTAETPTTWLGPLNRRRLSARKFIGVFKAILWTLDVFTVSVSVLLGSLARAEWNFFGEAVDQTWTLHLAVTHGPWIAAIWVGWLSARGSYSGKHLGAGSEEFNRVFVGSLLAAGTIAMVCYLLKYDLSRGLVVMSFLLGIPLLLAQRVCTRKVLHGLRKRGSACNRVLVVGDPSATAEITEILLRERHMGYSVIGACAPTQGSDDSGVPHAMPLLGTASDVRETALRAKADTVIVAGGHFGVARDIREIAWSLSGTDLDLIVVPSLTDIAGPRIHVRPVAGLPLLFVDPPQVDNAVRLGKRVFDITGSAFLLIVTAPLWLLIAAMIKLADGGPVFFRQRRVGLSGAAFDCLKFRSMSTGAEKMRLELLHLNESDGPLFKIRDDPRITQVGKLLRRYSLDELPQLLNVFRGEMSLVGPRPPLPAEVDEYGVFVTRRLLVRPGITGLWQVSGRSTLSWDETVRLDLYYVDNWSFFQDLLILLKTFRAVLRGHGAC